jgi:hypothetical protein
LVSSNVFFKSKSKSKSKPGKWAVIYICVYSTFCVDFASVYTIYLIMCEAVQAVF